MPVDFFFYGTLRDAEVRRIVLGPGAVTLVAEPAVLEGYRCAPAEGGRFPGIVAEEGAVATGVLVRGVSLDAAARISYFEGDGTDYDIVPKTVGLGGGQQARAWVCLPADIVACRSRPVALRRLAAALATGVSGECSGGDGARYSGRIQPLSPHLAWPAQPRADTVIARHLTLRRFRMEQASRASL